MEQNLNTAPLIDDNLLDNNIDSNDLQNKIIEDIINIDLEIIDIIKTEEDALFNTLDQFEANELPIEEIIDLTNESAEDEEEEQIIIPYGHVPAIDSVLEGEILKIFRKTQIVH